MRTLGQARFWILWGDSWVRIKLNAGDEITCFKAQPTDEGWSRESRSYLFDGERVLVQGADEGRDCDGRHGYYWQAMCEVCNLQARACECVPCPDWVHLKASQYDEYAEMAGY